MQYVFSDFRLQYSQGLQDYRLHSKDIKQMFTTIEQRRKPSNTIAIESLSYSPLPNKRQIGGGGGGGRGGARGWEEGQGGRVGSNIGYRINLAVFGKNHLYFSLLVQDLT